MNGVHDMGGMHGFGPVQPEENEPVLQSTWQARAFGMAVAMESQGRYQWQDFRCRLIEQIGLGNCQEPPPDYYQQWLTTLEQLAVSIGFVTEEEMNRRTGEIAGRQEH